MGATAREKEREREREREREKSGKSVFSSFSIYLSLGKSFVSV